MDWARNTDRHRATLMRLVALVFVWCGLADDTRCDPAEAIARARAACREPWLLSRRVRRMVLALLRPVEAATRRLILMLASGLPGRVARRANEPAPLPTSEAASAAGAGVAAQDAPPDSPPVATPPSAPARLRLFALADPAKPYDWFFSGQPHGPGWQGPPKTSPYEAVDAVGILRRVAALALALEDLTAQAERLVRWRARRIAARAAGKFVSLSPLRPGRPPGALPRNAPKSESREEHFLLGDLDGEARQALARLDSS